MKTKLIWMGLAIAIGLGIPLLSPEMAITAIPPLSDKHLKAMSDYVVLGTVTNIQSREVRVDMGTDYSYKARIQVNRIELSRANTLTSKRSIEVLYRKTGKRPNGWVGPQGQSQLLEKNRKVKLFIRRDAQGNLHLLEPNGWQPIN
ncbi:hypothetical protein PseudUWO311_11460 [Pseudanabaena sp. UWO311]|uniref:hypothetical protein n=1 Tax=Pseudanabaena sp. UWO311 TaxID=2487337 RepID=UPI001158BC69|nr:hypothetical protein [Pseudanabaena sp. UWO311]TYQ26715.1 hypothetical protein PseudUWO311_11460 [Pseudanabaena sp. UWO311]